MADSKRKTFEFKPDSKADDDVHQRFVACITQASKLRATSTQKPYLVCNEALAERLSADYLAWRQSLCSGFGGNHENTLHASD